MKPLHGLQKKLSLCLWDLFTNKNSFTVTKTMEKNFSFRLVSSIYAKLILFKCCFQCSDFSSNW